MKASLLPKLETCPDSVLFSSWYSHYFINKGWLAHDYILKNTNKILNIPITIVQGRYDMVCPPEMAWKLYRVSMLLECSFTYPLLMIKLDVFIIPCHWVARFMPNGLWQFVSLPVWAKTHLHNSSRLQVK